MNYLTLCVKRFVLQGVAIACIPLINFGCGKTEKVTENTLQENVTVESSTAKYLESFFRAAIQTSSDASSRASLQNFFCSETANPEAPQKIAFSISDYKILRIIKNGNLSQATVQLSARLSSGTPTQKNWGYVVKDGLNGPCIFDITYD
jgi:hypothetical protein